MKKTYTSPHTEIIELGTTNLIAVSIPGIQNNGNNDDKWANEYDAGEYRSALESGGDDDYVNENEALSSEYRSDWENIWANM